MKTFVLACTLLCSALPLAAGKQKGCEMNTPRAKALSASGKVSCKAGDCSFRTADGKTSYALCEMSKANLPKLSRSGAVVTISGKLFSCEGKEKLQILKVEK